MDDPIDGKWYWVFINNQWSPALRDSTRAGGWTNDDCWEDFSNEVKVWIRIPEVSEMQTHS